MRSKIALYMTVAAVFFAGAYAAASWVKPLPQKPAGSYPTAVVRLGGEEFSAYVADTPELREKGLSGLRGLSQGEAMLFPFEEPGYLAFWMKDMLFSIDILWLDESDRVVSFVSDVSPDTFPQTFSPEAPALSVVEFSAGTLARLGVKAGDRAEISAK